LDLAFTQQLTRAAGVGDLRASVGHRWDYSTKLRYLVRSRNLDPGDAPRLSGKSVTALAASLGALPVGKRGWITLREASRLFSRVDDGEEAFGELDGDEIAQARDLVCKCFRVE
jgi:hypothetical protein